MHGYHHACPDAECHCFDALEYTVTHPDGCAFAYTHFDSRTDAKPYRDALAHARGHPDAVSEDDPAAVTAY